MTVTCRTVRDGVIVHHVAETDLEGNAAVVLADLNEIDTGSIGLLRGLISAAENIFIKLSNEPKSNRRLCAARHAKRFALAAISYVEAGDAESATFNALSAAHNAWIMDVKGVEREIVKGAKIIETRKKAAYTTNERVRIKNANRDREISQRAKALIEAGTATKSSVSQYIVDEGISRGLKVDAVRDILRKGGVR